MPRSGCAQWCCPAHETGLSHIEIAARRRLVDDSQFHPNIAATAQNRDDGGVAENSDAV